MGKVPLIIALDGPSGSGKSTVSVRLALHFQIPCLDTGAMYRSVALKALQRKIPFTDESKIIELASSLQFQFRFEGATAVIECRENDGPWERMGPEIRTPEISMTASHIAKLGAVRKVLVAEQQRIGREHGGVVEGRDAGTVIFPDTPYKFYLTASPEVRAKRRCAELQERLGAQAPDLDEVMREMVLRDKQDSERVESPLKPADNAIVVDTSAMSLEKVFSDLVQRILQVREATK